MCVLTCTCLYIFSCHYATRDIWGQVTGLMLFNPWQHLPQGLAQCAVTRSIITVKIQNNNNDNNINWALTMCYTQRVFEWIIIFNTNNDHMCYRLLISYFIKKKNNPSRLGNLFYVKLLVKFEWMSKWKNISVSCGHYIIWSL